MSDRDVTGSNKQHAQGARDDENTPSRGSRSRPRHSSFGSGDSMANDIQRLNSRNSPGGFPMRGSAIGAPSHRLPRPNMADQPGEHSLPNFDLMRLAANRGRRQWPDGGLWPGSQTSNQVQQVQSAPQEAVARPQAHQYQVPRHGQPCEDPPASVQQPSGSQPSQSQSLPPQAPYVNAYPPTMPVAPELRDSTLQNANRVLEARSRRIQSQLLAQQQDEQQRDVEIAEARRAGMQRAIAERARDRELSRDAGRDPKPPSGK